MANLKSLLRGGGTVWFEAAVAVACSPAAESPTSESGPLFVDEHATGAAPLEEVVIARSESSGGAQEASTGDAPTDVHSADPIADVTAGTAAAAPASSPQDLVTAEQDGTSQVAVASNALSRPARAVSGLTDDSATART